MSTTKPDAPQSARNEPAARPRSVDAVNQLRGDGTVGADGKEHEADRSDSIWQDNVVYSNATLDNAFDTPDDGLGGIDSRPGGNAPLIDTVAGCTAVREGVVVRHTVFNPPVGDYDRPAHARPPTVRRHVEHRVRIVVDDADPTADGKP